MNFQCCFAVCTATVHILLFAQTKAKIINFEFGLDYSALLLCRIAGNLDSPSNQNP